MAKSERYDHLGGDESSDTAEGVELTVTDGDRSTTVHLNGDAELSLAELTERLRGDADEDAAGSAAADRDDEIRPLPGLTPVLTPALVRATLRSAVATAEFYGSFSPGADRDRRERSRR